MDEMLPAGHHEVRWDGTNSRGLSAASGVYYYTLSAGGSDETRKMVLLR
jgi:flagellar hook assembly protein FlgD